MSPGSLVVILGGWDTRLRAHDDSVLTIGTVDQILCDGQVMVLLDGGDLWTGSVKMVVLAEEQR